MKYIAFVLVTLINSISLCTGEEKQKDTSSLNIITKVPFNGQYYFIQITPIEKGNRDHMPMVGGKSIPNQKTLFWNDSLQHILPDSILHMLKDIPKLKLK
ncbi:MAG: hypothetical protein NTX44_05095 [Ignavibacteriales bacterium]|nr:hypothetical protein [Ignavibacteriales bacterium]